MQKLASLIRPKLAAIVAIAFVALLLSAGIHSRGTVPAAWNMLHIPANTPLFSDTRGITHAIDCVVQGQDPYRVNRCDPWHRLYNYPPIWLLARHLGITSQSSNAIGLLFAVAAITAYILLLNSRSLLTGAIVFLAIASRCVLLSIERGNTDQIVFFVLVFGFFLIYRQRPEIRARSLSVLLVALTILKVYPIAAVTIFLRRKRGWKLALLTAGVAAAALLATSGRRLAFVIANTPRDPDTSFGTFPFFLTVSRHTLQSLAPLFADHRAAAPLAALVIASIGMFWGAHVGTRLDHVLPPLDLTRTRAAIAIACISIYSFAFLAGSSYDYRLIYLMGALAWLVEDLDKRRGLRSLPATLLILVLLWKPLYLSLTGELLDGLVFLMSTAWLGNTIFSQRTEDSSQLHSPSQPAPQKHPFAAPTA
ncbi:hypothetical protein JAO29_04440 [Edaphobacter sp. HDX4]|uniref:hypothetical protein n=1 Tax=Edaphobacter sp. HDX4 TaxID=2794064 RepID=UPI002FE5745F